MSDLESPPAPVHRRRGLVLAAVVAAAILAALVAARPAVAGSYVVTECSQINPHAAGASWERSSDHYRSRSRCGTTGGLQAYHDAERTGHGHYGAWVWRAPGGTVFTALQANASLTAQAGHRGELIATRTGGETVGFGAEHGDFRVHSIAGEFAQLHSWLRCAAANGCGRAGDDSGHAYVRGVFLRTDDRSAPTVELGGGSLLADPVVRGVRGLAFAGTDAGGGIRRIAVAAGGVTIASDVRNCALADGFATLLRPCPASSSAAVAVPTAGAGFATGPNQVSACVEDLALDGFANRDCETRTVWVDNACPDSAVAADSVTARFGGGASATVRSDQQALIHGRVGGGDVAGAIVCALARTRLAGAPVLVAATARADSGGSFALALPPGPSRDVYVHHAAGDRVVARHGLVLRSSVHPALSVRPRRRVANGDRLRFRGTLPGPACSGRVVKVQARLGRRRWQVFRTDRTDAVCAFTARYRLRATRGARRYRFRALVPAQAGYPYERGHSRIARVAVRR